MTMDFSDVSFYLLFVLSKIFPYFCVGLLLVLIVSQWMAFRYNIRRQNQIRKGGAEAAESAIFALVGLLVAFSFSGAYSRFEARRQITVNETNAIGTAFLRLDILPEEPRLKLQGEFVNYIDSRIGFYYSLDRPVVNDLLMKTDRTQSEIWRQGVESTNKEYSLRMLILPAFNEMFDIVQTANIAVQAHTSAWIFLVLFFNMVVCSVIAGLNMARKGRFLWGPTIMFAAVLAVTVYMILDLEFPRLGLVTLDFVQNGLISLKASMMAHISP